ncbi:hypothetical protein TW80_16900 [Loktanella sp. S4079]|nr:hypothetical protein TW80_16900 [Loktanella sp. S4079]
MEHVLPSSRSIREKQIHTITARHCLQFAGNSPRRLENLCASLIIQIFKTADMLQRNNQRMAFK